MEVIIVILLAAAIGILALWAFRRRAAERPSQASSHYESGEGIRNFNSNTDD